MADELCPHDLTPQTCSICKHGPTKPEDRPDETSHCRTCQAEIIWVVTEKGKKMPIDAEPTSSDDGRFRKERLDPNGDKVVHFVRDDELASNDRPLYASHFQTCPDRDVHRKSR